MNQDIIQKLTQLKNKVDDMKIKKQTAENSIKTIEAKLLKEFNVNTIDEGEDLLETWNKELKKKEQELSEVVNKLEKAIQ